MKEIIIKLSISTAVASLLFITNAWSCTEMRVTAENGASVIGRSMEFGNDPDSSLVIQPRGQKRSSSTPGGGKGISWTSKYGIAYMDGFGLDMAADGMNEKGLSFGALYLPSFAEYQAIPKGGDSKALGHLDFGLWILGNFSTVDEVRAALDSVYVWAQPIKKLNNVVLPLHYSVYDSSGKGMVIEYTKDGLKTYDNVLGVMTNSPTFDWHLSNVRNYVKLTSEDASPVEINGVSFAANGLGSGLLGLPGDPSPPSRLIRTAAMVHLGSPVKDNEAAVNLVEHILNAVDIPTGLIRNVSDGKAEHDRTIWVILKDMQAKKVYYRSYNDLAMKVVDLNKLDFSEKGKRFSIPVEHGKPTYIDVTGKLN